MKLIVIAAIARNGVIGRSNGDMPWHVKEEFQHFKNTTLGFPVIMGRKTFQSLGKPLKGRLNIVISRKEKPDPGSDEIKVFNNIKDSIEYCSRLGTEKAFITGGGEIFRQSVSLADEMILSFMNFNAEGDVYFPEIDTEMWKEESREKRSEFEIVRYIRADGKQN